MLRLSMIVSADGRSDQEDARLATTGGPHLCRCARAVDANRATSGACVIAARATEGERRLSCSQRSYLPDGADDGAIRQFALSGRAGWRDQS